MKYFVDSSAWIEYLEGSSIGEQVWKLLSGDNEIFVSSINVAEVVSKVTRAGKDAKIAFDSMISNSKVFDLKVDEAREAGLLHAEMKRKNKSFGLADAMILVSARKVGGKLVTKDSHFKGISNVLILK